MDPWEVAKVESPAKSHAGPPFCQIFFALLTCPLDLSLNRTVRLAGNDRADAYMRLYLIRHGETVDNVAGLYAGSRDSTLTNHGVEQTKRLGGYFAKEQIFLTHIFASPLSRAYKTAQAIQQAQKNANSLEIIPVADLKERDFGRFEGKPYSTEEKAYKPETKQDVRKTGWQLDGIESGESLAKRSDSFIDDFVLPLLATDRLDEEYLVAVVAHGMLLSHLWRRLLLRLPRKSLTIAPEITAAKGNLILEHLGGWSNTGYLELAFTRDANDRIEAPRLPSTANAKRSLVAKDVKPADSIPDEPQPSLQCTDPEKLFGWSTTIIAIDSKLHLLGLKRQRGGIGSLAHDEGQRKLDGFFSKRPKTG